MKFSIVIPTHRRHHSLARLLQSLQKQEVSRDEMEVVIVPNLKDHFFESEEFQRIAEGLNLRVSVLGEKSVNKARNFGLKQSGGEIALLLDDDCELDRSTYLQELEQWHSRHPHALAIGGTYKVDSVATPMDRAYNCVARQWQALEHFGEYRSSRLVGGNVSYKLAKLKQIGEWFDESIHFGGTEAEFHQRLNEKGFETLYISSLEVIHQTSLTMNSLIEKAMLQAQGHLKYNIESGFSDVSSKTYQNKRLLYAKEITSSQEEFYETVHWMNLYDWAYNYTCENPEDSLRKIFSKSKNWQSRSHKKNKSVEP